VTTRRRLRNTPPSLRSRRRGLSRTLLVGNSCVRGWYTKETVKMWITNVLFLVVGLLIGLIYELFLRLRTVALHVTETVVSRIKQVKKNKRDAKE
jgi:hypothetical protein